MVADGGITNGLNNTGLSGAINTQITTSQSASFQVCDDQQELRIGLAWVEGQGIALLNDIDLEVLPPGGTPVYFGNLYTDDNDRDGVVGAKPRPRTAPRRSPAR